METRSLKGKEKIQHVTVVVGKPINLWATVLLNLIFAGMGFFYLRKWWQGFLSLSLTILANLLVGLWGGLFMLGLTMLACFFEARAMEERHEKLKQIGGEAVFVTVGVIAIIGIACFLVMVKGLEDLVSSEAYFGDIKTEGNIISSDIGETLNFGNFEYTVNSALARSSFVGTQELKEAEGTFLVIDLSIQNIGPTEKGWSPNDIVVSDGIGNLYSTFSFGYSESSYVPDLLPYTTFNPGKSIRGKLVFDIPESLLKDPDLKLKLSSGEFLDSNEAYVNLTKIKVMTEREINSELLALEKKIKTLRDVYISVDNFDADPEVDGLELTITPEDKEGKLVKARGKIFVQIWPKTCIREGEYWGCEEEACIKSNYPIESWSKAVTMADYSSYSGVPLQLEYTNPLSYYENLEPGGGCVDITFTLLSGESFRLSEEIYSLS
ncbi:MAG: DUF4352 domain-containing protein [Candidatus Woesearchaeota archaeon]